MVAPTKARSVPSEPVSTSQPRLTSPTSASAPTRTLSKKVLQNSPSYMVWIGRRAGQHLVAPLGRGQIFSPLITQPSPSRTALVRSEARSEPEFGSLYH